MSNLLAGFVALAIGIAATVTVYQSIKQVGRVEGQQRERARVETQEAKTDARIKKAQSATARKPAASVLDKWSTD